MDTDRASSTSLVERSAIVGAHTLRWVVALGSGLAVWAIIIAVCEVWYRANCCSGIPCGIGALGAILLGLASPVIAIWLAVDLAFRLSPWVDRRPARLARPPTPTPSALLVTWNRSEWQIPGRHRRANQGTTTRNSKAISRRSDVESRVEGPGDFATSPCSR